MPNCVNCGSEFVDSYKKNTHPLNQKLYCTKECRRKYSNRKIKVKRNTVDVLIPCRACLKPFKIERKNQCYCSDKCRDQRKPILNKICTNCSSDFITTVSYITKCKTCLGQPYHRICQQCSSPFKTPMKSQVYCSRKCSRLNHSLLIKKRNSLITEKTCTGCNQVLPISSFRPRAAGNGKKVTTYCIDCNKSTDRARSAKRRIWYGNIDYKLDVFSVFREANYKCQCCGIDTPKELRGSVVPNAPELDHIIPLSRGGSHTYENTQLLCRKCNITKSNKTDYAKTGIRAYGLSHQAG